MGNNRDRKGIFLGVISVATLIVAIIGATFAYFSATITANEEVNFTAYQFSASASVTKVAPSGDVEDLIPVDNANVLILANNTQNNSNGACKDANNYSACLVYDVTINNTGTNNLSLTGELVTVDPGTYTHLKIMPVSESNGTYTAIGDPMDISSNADGTTGTFTLVTGTEPNIVTNDVTFTVNSGGTDTHFYFIIYLDNVTTGDQNEEMGSTFTGQFVFSGADGGQLKATITPVSP